MENQVNHGNLENQDTTDNGGFSPKVWPKFNDSLTGYKIDKIFFINIAETNITSILETTCFKKKDF